MTLQWPSRPAPRPASGQLLPGCTLAELESFVELCERRSFTATARHLHVSQPGLSARIRGLERALGVVLIDRTVRPIHLTRAGHAFLPAAQRALRELERGVASARERRGQED